MPSKLIASPASAFCVVRHVSTLFLLLMLPASSACKEAGSATDAFEVSGVVTDETNGNGIGGATVTFVSDTLFRTRTSTGGGGDYEMTVDTDVPFGQVRAEKEGFVSGEATVHFDTRARRIDLQLRPAR